MQSTEHARESGSFGGEVVVLRGERERVDHRLDRGWVLRADE